MQATVLKCSLGYFYPICMLHGVYRFGLDASRCLMVGDRLNTDIAFGLNGGMKTLLVLTGITTLDDVNAPDNTVHPDFYIKSLGDLYGKI